MWAAAGSFIPPAEIAAIRELTRYRKKLIGSGPESCNGCRGLEDGGIKIDSVASSITTLSAAGHDRGADRRGT